MNIGSDSGSNWPKLLSVLLCALVLQACVRGGQGLRVKFDRKSATEYYLDLRSDRNYEGGYTLKYNPDTGMLEFEPKGVQNSEAQGFETVNKALDKIPNASNPIGQ